MNCPSCGSRTLASLSNCPHCNAHLGELGDRSYRGGLLPKFNDPSGATDPSHTGEGSQLQSGGHFTSGMNHFGDTPGGQERVHQVSGKTMLALLVGFGVLGAIAFLVVPMYYESQGYESHYQVLWCTNTEAGAHRGTSADEIGAQGFVRLGRLAPGYSRLGAEGSHRVQCFSKDYGQQRPSYRNIDNHSEYRVVSTYYASPDE